MTRITPRTALLMTLPPLLWAGNAVVGRLTVGSVPPLTLNFLRWVLAAPEDLDDPMRLDVVVALGDVDADHLPDADVAHRLGRDDQEVAGSEVGLHAVREHGLGAVEARVGEKSEEQKRREGDAQQHAQGEVGERQALPTGARPEPRVRARLDRCEGHGYLLVAARCVPVNVY